MCSRFDAAGGRLGRWRATTLDRDCGMRPAVRDLQRKFANGVNFRGFPHIPGSDFVLRVPQAGRAARRRRAGAMSDDEHGAAAARRWLGTPYRHQASTARGGVRLPRAGARGVAGRLSAPSRGRCRRIARECATGDAGADGSGASGCCGRAEGLAAGRVVLFRLGRDERRRGIAGFWWRTAGSSMRRSGSAWSRRT